MNIEASPGPDMFVKAFDDPAAAVRYEEGMRRFVPGVDALHRMATLLLAERAPENARVLVLGAGGGAELKELAQAKAKWNFVGIDPAGEMLNQAERVLGPTMMERVDLVQGYIDSAPEGPFDAAICLLTLHFLDHDERIRTVREIHRRLRPGAPFVVAHASFPQGAQEREIWLDRYAAYPVAMGADPVDVNKARAAVAAGLNCFAPEQDEAILRAGGFEDLALFYAALTWRGWVAYG